jgi:hypothetical protein
MKLIISFFYDSLTILASFVSVKGEPLVSEALAEGLCYKAGHGVLPFPFGFRLELDSFLYRTC